MRKAGAKAEDLASRFLERNGFIIVERNYYAKRFGEIDIVALKGGVLHFIEVKSSAGSFDPIYNLSPAKLRRVINSAHYYLNEKGLELAFCIDAIVIRKGEIELLENITL